MFMDSRSVWMANDPYHIIAEKLCTCCSYLSFRELWIVDSYLMLVLVFRMLRYWRMSGKVIRRSALRNLRPIQVLEGRILDYE